ncbi:MAG: DUF1553 domain-containing protein, partial [Bryobacterales bacterium]|nr:DUF1553 domain-containing protein [Bryobacterales bacterium]
LRNPSDAAYEKLVDKLLESPHYGERWARIWLDLARYADSQGYEKDALRTIWPYRDWVIDALNKNLPFDQFALKQIAGDLLPNPSESDLIATGFHRNTMTNTEGGTDDEEFRDIAVRDRVATTGVAFMGLTWGCAQCHTHKYDPLSHREFYQLYAFFNQTEDADKPDDSPVLKLANGSTPIFRELPAEKRRQTRIFDRGNFLNPGEPVEAAVPQAFHPMAPDAPKNRLGLAKWLTDRNNPLTARVQVNRYWARMFGRGLVETEEDFGTQGQLPSHPELLDWLAVDFMERGWDMKAALKTIVMSATYRQSAAASPELRAKDPNNVLLARGARFRIDAEMVRDQALALSGLLNRKLYGPPVMPWQPDGIWQVVYSGAQWETGNSEERYRRAIYTMNRRTTPYPAMQTFDAPSGEVCTARRIRTNTPLQALASLNDPALMEAAQNLGLRTAEEKGSDADRAARLFERLTLRKPSDTEQKRIVALYKDAAADLKKDAEATHRLLNYGQRLYSRDRESTLLGDGREDGAQWRYVTEKPATDEWLKPDFSDAAWSTGPGQFGLLATTAKKPEPLLRTKWDTEELWLRREFTVPEQGVDAVRLLVRTDAAFEAYVNGVPAAATDMNRSGYYGYTFSKEALAAIQPGRNVLAIHAKRSYEPVRGQVFDAGLLAARPVAQGEQTNTAVTRAAWIMVANALLNLDEVLVHP